jgi:predicted MPP superfamily phosphohydrolase
VNTTTLALPNWSAPLTIAALSDLHVGSAYNDLPHLREVVAQTNAQHPDVIVLLGDFSNSDRRTVAHSAGTDPNDYAPILAQLRAPLGVYAVLGNHDWWDNGAHIGDALRAHGIRVLDNQAVRVEHHSRAFWIGGLADLWTGHPDIPGVLSQTNPAEPLILITHNPDIFPDVPARASLTIAGHTHGGQVDLPIIGRPITVSDYNKGHIVEGGRHMFITTGVGTSGLPVRFRVPPEIAILRLTPRT